MRLKTDYLERLANNRLPNGMRKRVLAQECLRERKVKERLVALIVKHRQTLDEVMNDKIFREDSDIIFDEIRKEIDRIIEEES